MALPGTKGKPAYRLYQLAWAGLDWLYPPQCGGCNKSGSRWCINCQQATEILPEAICPICGEILKSGEVCARCRQSAPAYAGLRSWAIYKGPVRNAIHRLKYKGEVTLGEALARPMLELFLSTGWQIDLVTPVPAGRRRGSERGYNQAALLALPLALGSRKAYKPEALVKVRETRSQVGLNASQRWENVAEAFEARKKQVDGKNVLVVDDVTTSGATIAACTTALLKMGAQRVYGLTLARADYKI